MNKWYSSLKGPFIKSLALLFAFSIVTFADDEPDHGSKPDSKFDISQMNGSYLLKRETGKGGCLTTDPNSDEGGKQLKVDYDLRVFHNDPYWPFDKYFNAVNLETESYTQLEYFRDIDQGALAYTRHDIENPGLLERAECVAWYAKYGIVNAVRYCSSHPKGGAVPNYNPSQSYKMVTYTLKDNSIVSEDTHVMEPQKDVTLQQKRMTLLNLIDANHLKLEQRQKLFSDKKIHTVKECFYERR